MSFRIAPGLAAAFRLVKFELPVGFSFDFGLITRTPRPSSATRSTFDILDVPLRLYLTLAFTATARRPFIDVYDIVPYPDAHTYRTTAYACFI